MGKSPGKWIKTVLFGKKSSKSNLSKDATLGKKTSVNSKAPSKDFDNDSMVISSPVPPVMHVGGERTELVNNSSVNLTSDSIEVITSTTCQDTLNKDKLISLERAATVAQAAFRGYMARRAYLALKGIIRLQAHIRGSLVRRQAVATLSCMCAIVEFQALARGRMVRLSGHGHHVLQKNSSGELVDKKRADLLGTSLRSEKLSTSAFGTKLVASSNTIMSLSLQYDPVEPNSVRNWLNRWSASHFWELIPLTKKIPDTKPKRKQTKLQLGETEHARPKRSVRHVPAASLEGNLVNLSEYEKPKSTFRKVYSHQAESVQEQSHNELKKVKRSLRKISVSTSGDKTPPNPDASELGMDRPFKKVNDSNVVMTILPQPEALPVPSPEEDEDKTRYVLQEDHHSVKPPTDGKAEIEPRMPMNVEINGNEYNCSKEKQKTSRRKSFPAKHEQPESVLQNMPSLPSYMAATESAKAKLKAQAVAKAAEDGSENGFIRRQSLPSSTTGKMSLQSPRVQKPLQSNVKGWTKSNTPQISARDNKTLQTGWKR